MMVKCGVVQFNHRPGDKAANFKIIEHYAAAAFAADVKVLALPEMCLTGYWHARHLDRDGWVALSERIPEGPWCQALIALAGRFDMAIGVGLVEQAEDGRLFNAYVVAMPDGKLHRHRKIHAFESRHVSSGDGYTVFGTPWGFRLGVLICWDNNLVENVRATALLGADILLAPHQTGATDSRSPHGMRPIDPLLWHRRTEDPERLRAEFQGEKGRGWLMRWLPSRAHDNGMFLLFANGVGEDDGEHLDRRRHGHGRSRSRSAAAVHGSPMDPRSASRTLRDPVPTARARTLAIGGSVLVRTGQKAVSSGMVGLVRPRSARRPIAPSPAPAASAVSPSIGSAGTATSGARASPCCCDAYRSTACRGMAMQLSGGMDSLR